MLRLGKITENALKRSVLKEISLNRDICVISPNVGEDASVLKINAAEELAVTTDVVSISCCNVGEVLVTKGVNNLSVQGAEPICINLSVLLPIDEDEKTLKKIIRDAEKTAKRYRVQISGGHTEITGAVNNPVVTGTTIGKIKDKGPIITGGVKPGNDIILTKWVGLEGTALIVNEKKNELYKLFPASFIETAALFGEYTCVKEEADIAYDYGVNAMKDVSSGGIFGTLWEMAEASNVGLDIDLMSIPIRQETIEICEVYGVNPYQLLSGGSLILACDNGDELIEKMKEVGIPAVKIGTANSSSNRLIHNDDEIRFLDMPMSDEILKIFNNPKIGG